VFEAQCCRIDSFLVALSLERQVGLMRCLVFEKIYKLGRLAPGLSKVAAELSLSSRRRHDDGP
jgi:hypothetical protein